VKCWGGKHMLPEIKKVKMPSLTLPTVWQTVIFRNYGYVYTERLAKVLSCDNETVEREARRLGLADRGYAEVFAQRGYITIIRNNWFLLPYQQILELLDISEEKLDFILEKDDFLAVKLGNFKPECPCVVYSPLTEDQIFETESIASRISEYLIAPDEAPFDFFGEAEEGVFEEMNAPRFTKNGKRILHGYLSPCGDAFATDCSDTLPDELLEKYRRAGVDGVWLHGVLSSLSPYPFMPSLSEGYMMRRDNMNRIIERCKKYGISLYLYLNEPRALPVCTDSRYERLIGWKSHRTLCLENEEVREYLYNAVYDLCVSVPDLGGIFTITMSENPTHCNFTNGTECPVCKNISPEKSASAVNNIIYKAMKDSGCNGELIANLWGWSPYLRWSEDQIFNGIELLDKGISVLSVSEYDLEIEKGGVKSRIIDYSVSNPGPSDITKKVLSKAEIEGHRIYAKIQASNSWECSAVPYIPVFDLVYEHLENLADIGVEDLFLTWTQGGYPSPSVEIATKYHKNFDLEAWYKEKYGELSGAVHSAIKEFCMAFREYPFSIRALYMSPKTLACANLWDIELEEKSSTMVCFSYDDYLNWCTPYPIDIYISQLKKLLDGWKKGIDMLVSIANTPETEEILCYSKAVYCHFYADLLQTLFGVYKRKEDREGMLRCVLDERSNAEELLRLMKSDAKIGYEASNHYFYTERNLVEKIIRMDIFEKRLKQSEN